jgi:hypothetical protein
MANATSVGPRFPTSKRMPRPGPIVEGHYRIPRMKDAKTNMGKNELSTTKIARFQGSRAFDLYPTVRAVIEVPFEGG